MEKIIKKFFKERPAISVAGIENEAGIPATTLTAALNGGRGIPEKHKEKLIKVLEKYGLPKNSILPS